MSDDAADSVAAIQRFDAAAGWRDTAGRKFEQQVSTLKDELSKLRDSYGTASSALATYEKQLRASQQQARQALNAALEAKANVDSAQRAKAAITGQGAAGQAPPDTSTYDRLQQDGTDGLTRARALMQQACNDRDHAANSCKGQIQDAHNEGMQNKSLWDHVTDAVSDACGWVDAHLDEISTWCSRIGMVLAVAGMFFPVLEPFAVAVTLIGLAADAELAREGKKPWMEVGVAAALTAATLGMGGLARGLTGKAADEIAEKAVPAAERVTSSEAKLATQRAKYADAARRGEANAALKGWVTRRTRALEDAKAEVSRLAKAARVFPKKELDPWLTRITHVGKWTDRENSPTWEALKSPGNLVASAGGGASSSVRWVRAALPADALAQTLDKVHRVHDVDKGSRTFAHHPQAAAG
jgi:hypothetical protein